jgi:hypothetical protein
MSGWNGIFYNGIWCCGVDFLPTGALGANSVFNSTSGATIGPTYARFTGKGAQLNSNTYNGGYLGKALGVNLASMYLGFSFESTGLPSSGLFIIATFYDATAGGAQVSLCYNSSGELGFYTGNGLLSYDPSMTLLTGSTLSAVNTIIPNSYCYIEVFLTINAGSGVLQVNVNGPSVLSLSGLNTRSTANSWVNYVYLGSGQTSGYGNNHNIDDIYMLDTTGAAPFNTFLGPGRIQTDGPTADSATSGLNAWSYTTPPGTDYGCCANIPANATQYCYDSNPGDRMSFKFPSLATAKVFFLNTWFSVQEDASGTRTIVPIFRNNSIDQVGPSAISLATSYSYYNQISTLDPNTGSAWSSESVATAAGCEIGLKVAS